MMTGPETTHRTTQSHVQAELYRLAPATVTEATLAPVNLQTLNSICDKVNTRTGQSPNLELYL